MLLNNKKQRIIDENRKAPLHAAVPKPVDIRNAMKPKFHMHRAPSDCRVTNPELYRGSYADLCGRLFL